MRVYFRCFVAFTISYRSRDNVIFKIAHARNTCLCYADPIEDGRSVGRSGSLSKESCNYLFIFIHLYIIFSISGRRLQFPRQPKPAIGVATSFSGSLFFPPPRAGAGRRRETLGTRLSALHGRRLKSFHRLIESIDLLAISKLSRLKLEEISSTNLAPANRVGDIIPADKNIKPNSYSAQLLSTQLSYFVCLR